MQWSPWSESNEHASRPRLLRPVRLPIPPQGVDWYFLVPRARLERAASGPANRRSCSTELTRQRSIRSRGPAPPNRCGRFPPRRSASSVRVPCSGVACEIPTATCVHFGCAPGRPPGHTRSGADDESRTRGLDRGVVALCPLSYIRKQCETASASTGAVSQRVVKERAPLPVLRSSDRRLLRLKTKRPGSLTEPGPLRTERGGCALGGSLSRMLAILAAIGPLVCRSTRDYA